ncbi:hypothetical protein [Dongshaea marina]|uniref:hypothetical protein n=1 Tax=Dongshaea marina TaxID=2047966 RepID=UPI000D3E583E|nr:hypothetical protein [Dongshaea marina]
MSQKRAQKVANRKKKNKGKKPAVRQMSERDMQINKAFPSRDVFEADMKVLSGLIEQHKGEKLDDMEGELEEEMMEEIFDELIVELNKTYGDFDLARLKAEMIFEILPTVAEQANK